MGTVFTAKLFTRTDTSTGKIEERVFRLFLYSLKSDFPQKKNHILINHGILPPYCS
jgi:hypothetical protein